MIDFYMSTQKAKVIFLIKSINKKYRQKTVLLLSNRTVKSLILAILLPLSLLRPAPHKIIQFQIFNTPEIKAHGGNEDWYDELLEKKQALTSSKTC
ncbi:hypothetical protein BTJ05_08640 [Lactobacillus delbrueckii subsp. bulgaricus]|nr:hypothetical protein [Lactobacillus delbrueckii subsp. bulgaricus]MBT9079845.1 hypothetical protein [Lactobacillus delbrueckii subsp. bulgaricus]MBT9084647.1 hypothetical protein [Lactobacillus delbrueckii subsp. bulgaricus]MBT9087124.1 hypothetical protein [Lactobacillus delbrueckii subsp. bulgaricus]